jgi:hypothetical protein
MGLAMPNFKAWAKTVLRYDTVTKAEINTIVRGETI